MIETERLILREWRDADRAPFAAMGRDPEVMATLGPLLSRNETDALIDRLIAMQAEHGFCLWAVERKADGAFLGWNGLKRGDVGTIVGDVEIGWRQPRAAWGHGYAAEGARAALAWAFANTDAPRVAAMTAESNHRSRAVMERIGMSIRPALGFDHPRVNDPALNPHVVYVSERLSSPS